MEDHSLYTPFLSSDHTTITISTPTPTHPTPQPPTNLYSMLGVKNGGFLVPETSIVDPFRNNTLKIEGVYEWLKIVVCLPIVVLRLVLLLVSLVVGYFSTLFALYGWKDKDNPMPRWRCRIMWITRFSARCVLFSFGYQWIRRKGKPAPREVAPIVVSNHVSYIEPIFFFYELFPTIVASESHDSMPFVGTIIRAMQVIYVNRFSKPSRKQVLNEIKRKASSNRFPRVLLFPEGTTTNGRCLLSFQLGAFIPGHPVQPVVVRYPHVHFDQSWGRIPLAKLIFRMLTQFHNFMEVEYLPVISPDSQKESPVSFSQRTSHAIATALNVVQTSYNFGDSLLSIKACEFKQENPSLYMVEMAGVQSLFRISSLEAVDFLKIFLSMDPDDRGHVEFPDFLNALRLKRSSLAEKIFGFIDQQNIGKITFKQFLLGSVYILKQPLFEPACKLAFRECRRNQNNSISVEEFGTSLVPAIPNLNKNEIHALFKLFDTDCDGKISKDDFFTCMRRNPLLIVLFFPLLMHIDLSQHLIVRDKKRYDNGNLVNSYICQPDPDGAQA